MSWGVEVKVPRLCKRQTHRGNVGGSSDPSDYYKAKIAIPFLDYLYQELRCRFQKDDGPSYSVFSLVPGQMAKFTDSEVGRLANDLMFWGVDLESVQPDDFKSVLLEWRRACANMKEEDRPNSLLGTFKIADGDVFPDTKTLLHIGCTLPVTSSEAERSFSGLRRIKSYMRSMMNEDRLVALALMHIHHGMDINVPAICEEFAKTNKRRLFKSCIIFD